MKKIFLLLALVIASGLYLTTKAQTDADIVHKTKHLKGNKGEKIFIKQADKCLALIEQSAQKLSIKGVAIVAFIPGEVTESWISKMKVVGNLTGGGANLLGVASTKAAEMADTFKDSGSGIRKPLNGELGYQGGVIKKVDSGYILAVFSGGSSEQDVAVAKEGLNYLLQYYSKAK